MASENCLYITLQYLRTVNGRHEYHWGLYLTGRSPPSGTLLHATDAGRNPLDLYTDIRPVSNALKSRTMVVVLKIADSPGLDTLKYCASLVNPTDSTSLPPGEPKWTCRVWVKEVLSTLKKNGYANLPMDVDDIERSCISTADRYLSYMGQAKVFNDDRWMSSSGPSRTTPMVIDSTGGGSQYYGSKPMLIDSTGSGTSYYGSKPMLIDSTGSGTRYYGSKPMDTDPI